ncbi:hypothetical protein C8J57DRAFT_1422959, partial [Mycena rebaudengoi]
MAPLPIITLVLGGWDLATHVDLILQGLLFAQFTHYWARYRSDRLPLKLFVIGLCIATTVKSAHGIALVWYQNVEYFMDRERAGSVFASPSLGGLNILLMALITVYVQYFFLYRLWMLSRQTYYVSCLAVIFVFSGIAAIVTVVYAYAGTLTDDDQKLKFNANGVWIPIQTATVVAGDVLVCGSTIYFLMKQSRNALPETVGILHRLMRVTFQSAAPAALCATVSLFCDLYYNLLGRLDAVIPLLLISNMMAAKLYAISAMWTLNSRRDLRSQLSTVVSTGPGAVSEKFASSGQTTGMLQLRSDERAVRPSVQTDTETLAETLESVEQAGRLRPVSCSEDIKPAQVIVQWTI